MGDGRTVKFDGTNWSIGPSINSQQPDFSDISCVSQNFCMEVGGGVAALFNGNAWTHPTSIDGSNFLESVSCATVGQCLAIDSQDNALIYRNGSWGKPEAIPGLKRAGLNSISCPSINFCMAVADGGAAVFNGTKWARIKMGRDRKLWFVSCASPTSCAAVGLSSAAIYDGAKFSKERDIDSPYPLVGISCTKSSFCMAIDPTGQYLTRRLRSGSGS